jgi:hypothetical protein
MIAPVHQDTASSPPEPSSQWHGGSPPSPMEDAHLDSPDRVRERGDALAQRTNAMATQTHTPARPLRWWRGPACDLVVLGRLT